ncbi:MAG: triose-phosphate isomerase [Chloroflexi bacterium]|nr:triose-phosphate isomerase [Chloroflexota bacterium]MQC25990.1 triose-phosphate isomerase [Chloroflexota bacterium]
MPRTPLVAGNWKMHKTVSEALQLVEVLLPRLEAVSGVESLLCPPSTALMPLSAILDKSRIALGAQNLFWESEGAFTGELSASMVAEFCQYVIIGHSERRQIFGETNDEVNRKILAAIAVGLMPVLCVGESLAENEAGRAAEIITGQLQAALKDVALSGGGQLVIAYEPIWAIGTGKAATPEDIDTLLRNVVRPTLAGLFGEQLSQEVRVLYGGSVNPGNAADFFGQPEIDGALVGGASLVAEDFVAITQAASG